MTNKFAPIAALMDTDAYKLDHKRQYPEGTELVLTNMTARGSRVEGVTHTINFGLQYFIKSWVENAWKPFFEATEDEVAALYEEFTLSILGPNQIGSDHIRELHRVGHLPLKFRALPEGARVPLRVPYLTVENTDKRFFWLTNYIETALSSVIWQAATSATTADRFRDLLDEWAIKTTGTTAGVQWQGHDFSFRGLPGIEAAAASGAGHALSFTGSDNLNVVNFVNEYYPGDNGLIIGSVAATEHSVMSAGATSAPRDENGKIDEIGTYEHLLDLYPTGIFSVVSDTYDLWAVLTDVLPRLKDRILARDGKVVIRPDSGDPVDILTGTRIGTAPSWPAPSSEEAGVIELLWNIFGGTINEQGYKVLDPHIGAIYGDSITYDRAQAIFERLEAKGFASSNVVFGIGSYTYQYVTRDTYATALKATWVQIDGKGYSIFKDPITDNGTKKSARGRLAVTWESPEPGLPRDYVLFDDTEKTAEGIGRGTAWEMTFRDMLVDVWENGEFLKEYTFDEVRKNLHPEGLG